VNDPGGESKRWDQLMARWDSAYATYFKATEARRKAVESGAETDRFDGAAEAALRDLTKLKRDIDNLVRRVRSGRTPPQDTLKLGVIEIGAPPPDEPGEAGGEKAPRKRPDSDSG
jgi:hypothetical protein